MLAGVMHLGHKVALGVHEFDDVPSVVRLAA